MARNPKRGDVLIRGRDHSYEVVDALTLEPIAEAPSFMEALARGARHRSAVWRENIDDRGRSLGAPVLVLPDVFHD